MVNMTDRGGQQDAPSENKNKYTNEDLKTMQGWSLERKIRVTQTRIIEWYEHFDGQVYVSFSGGKDSTVLLDLVRRIYPDVPAVFVDTGLEYPELREFVKTIDSVVWLKPKMNFKEVISTLGYPVISKAIAKKIDIVQRLGRKCESYKYLTGDAKMSDGTPSFFNCAKFEFLVDAPFKVSHKCCDIMKKEPAKRYMKESGKKPILGTMASESLIRKNAWKRLGCNAFDRYDAKSQPMSFWTEQDVLEYLSRFNIPYASVYGEIAQDKKGKYYTTGCHRTGCIFCAFGCHLEKEPNRFQKLKETHPKLHAYCLKPMEEGGLGLAEVLDYIGVKYE